MALPASDDFERASLGSNWTTCGGGLNAMTITGSSDATGGTNGSDNMAYWNADSFNNDPYAETTFGANPSGFDCGPVVRANGGGDAYMADMYSNNFVYWNRYDNGSYAANGNTAWTWSASDTLRIEHDGSDVVVSVNGTEKLRQTDSTHTSGSAGIYSWYNYSLIESWEGGNLGPTTYTITSSIDALLNKTGITETSSIDVLLKALDITDVTSLNALLKSIDLTITSDIDALLKEQNLTLTSSLDAILQSLEGLTISTFVDAILQKYGSICWGHDTSVEEEYAENLSNWSGTAIVDSSGDTERFLFDSGEYMESPTWYLGAGSAIITTDKYLSGSGSYTVEFKTGSTSASCEASSYNVYGSSFSSEGWVKLKITSS